MDLAPEAVDETGQPVEEAEDLLALERQVCFAISIAARSVLSVYRPVLEPLGLTHPQYLVMLALWGRSPVTVKELGEMLQLDAPTLSPLLKRLEAAGLVTRARVPQDERQLRIELTERGRDLRSEALNVPPTIIAKLGMQPSELREVHRVLTALNASARNAGVEPLPAPAKGGV
jgi:MarR family transcriptional regulator, organic hydroperoxide resistance regulator